LIVWESATRLIGGASRVGEPTSARREAQSALCWRGEQVAI